MDKSEKKNKKAWEVLENYATGKRDKKGTLVFLLKLLEMYEKDLDILIACNEHPSDPSLVSQAYLKDEAEDKRFMICYTSIQRAKKTAQNTIWRAISCRNVMDNMFSRDVIKGLVFNPFDETEQIIVTKDKLLGLIELAEEFLEDINGNGNDPVC